MAFEEDYYDIMLKEMSGNHCSYTHCPIDKLEEIKTVLKMAKDRGGFRSSTFTSEETSAIEKVEELIKHCSAL